MKKITAIILLAATLVACGGTSEKNAAKSYVNSMSYKEKAFFEAIFPENGAEDVGLDEITNAFDMFVKDSEMIDSYFDREFETDEGKAFKAYYDGVYGENLKAYVAEAKALMAAVETGEDPADYMESLWNYDGTFIDLHNGFVELFDQY